VSTPSITIATTIELYSTIKIEIVAMQKVQPKVKLPITIAAIIVLVA